MAGPRYQWAAEGMAREYQKVRPDVNIVVDAFAEAEWQTKISLEAAAKGDAYDIIWANYSFIASYADAGFLLPLDAFLNKYMDYWLDIRGDVYPIILGMYNYKKKQWAIPHDSNTVLYYYRKDVLSEAGVSVPETWDEILDVAPKLHNPPDMYAVGGSLKRRYCPYFLLPMAWTQGGILWDENFVPHLNTKPWIEATKLLVDFYDYCPPEAIDWFEADTYQAMGNAGRFAIGPVIWGGPVLTSPEESKFADKIEVTLPPAIVLGGEKNRVVPMGGFGMSICAYSPNPDEAFDFIKFYTAKENQRVLVGYTGQPARVSALLDPENMKKARYFRALGLTLRYARPISTITEFAKFEELMGTNLNKILLGDLSIEEGLNEVNEQMYREMVRGGKIK